MGGVSKYTQTSFIESAKEAQHIEWDYSKTRFVNSTKKVVLTCPRHGDFIQEAASVLKGYTGCVGCSGVSKTTSQFLEEVREVWGDRWDLTNTSYTNAHTKTTLICRAHGEFSQFPVSIRKGQLGCKECKLDAKKSEILDKFEQVWGDRWDYSRLEYRGSATKVRIRCREHDVEFLQTVEGHRSGLVGCTRCSGRKLDYEDFIRRSKDVWGDTKWDYSNLTYLTEDKKVVLNCPRHGEYSQLVHDHLSGHYACRPCIPAGTSNFEASFLEFINSLGVDYTQQVRGVLRNKKMELDLVIPNRSLAVELNGVYWHSEKFKPRDYHHLKLVEAKEAGLRLIQVWEDDWRDRPLIVQEIIRQAAGLSTLQKISARDTVVRPISKLDAKEFLNKYHLQGYVSCSQFLGCMYNESLVAMAGLRKSGEDYILARYASSANVRGGHSKIVSFFERNYNYGKLLTFADLTYSEGDLYRQTGWSEDELLPPDYKYLRAGNRYHKFNFRVGRFKKDPTLKYEEGMTERELAELNNLHRVYDAGKIRFVKPHPMKEIHG